MFTCFKLNTNICLSDVTVGVLAIGPKVQGFKFGGNFANRNKHKTRYWDINKNKQSQISYWGNAIILTELLFYFQVGKNSKIIDFRGFDF
jgi:hypothetical protein